MALPHRYQVSSLLSSPLQPLSPSPSPLAGAASYHRRVLLLPPPGRHGEVGVEFSRQRASAIVPRVDHGEKAASRPVLQQFMTYSSGLSGNSNTNGDPSTTRIAADPDTHQDFQPTSKAADMSLQDIVAQDIKENPVLIYMKGYPDAPRCGFSALAVKVLQQYGVPISARDILTNAKLKDSVKAHTNWPTFPQIFIKGEFVGGSDIILNMHQKGELKDVIGDIAQKGEQNGAS